MASDFFFDFSFIKNVSKDFYECLKILLLEKLLRKVYSFAYLRKAPTAPSEESQKTILILKFS